MSNWTEGYVTEVDYLHGYYRELSPSLQRLALLMAGYAPPPESGAYLELGYGQGLSAAIHAAATPCEIWGADFNPSQAANAQSLLAGTGIDGNLSDESFGELAARRDLPKFQYIGLHGIWSWVSDENRAHIVDILRRNLAVGGVTYLSYNTQPGWSAALSLRHLLTLHAETAGAEAQGVRGRIDASLAFAQLLVDKGAAYFRANPLVAERLKKIAGQDRDYLAHEYFNRDWLPMAFSEVAERLSPAKLEFAASAHLLDQLDAINLSSDAQQIMREITHPVLRESIRDYFVNQQFRRDLFLRGPRRLSLLEQQEALLATRFSLLARPEDVPLNLATPAGPAELQAGIYKPTLEAMGKDSFRSRSLGELTRELPNFAFGQLLQAVGVLVGMGHVHPAQSEPIVQKAKPRTRALNAELCRRARSSGAISALASPVIGAGVLVGRFQQLFLLAMAAGQKAPEEWAKSARDTLLGQSQAVVKDGKALQTAEENLAELTAQAKEFADKRLPILKALGVA